MDERTRDLLFSKTVLWTILATLWGAGYWLVTGRKPGGFDALFVLLILIGMFVDDETGDLRKRLERIEKIVKGHARRALAPEVFRTQEEACRHWQSCPVCSAAGGERAALSDRCPLGRAFVEDWLAAEREFRQL